MNWFASLRRVVTGSKEPQTVERRIHPRYKMAFPVSITDNGGASHRGACGDLSLSGIAVLCDMEIEIGKQVLLTYALGDGSPVKKVKAVVRNRAGRRYGMEFVEER